MFNLIPDIEHKIVYFNLYTGFNSNRVYGRIELCVKPFTNNIYYVLRYGDSEDTKVFTNIKETIEAFYNLEVIEE